MTDGGGGVPKAHWGPRYWYVMHATAAAPLDALDRRASAVAFYRSIANHLPCAACADHYRAWLAMHPIEQHVADNDALMRWTYALHADVNQRLGKPTPPYDAVASFYRDGNVAALPGALTGTEAAARQGGAGAAIAAVAILVVVALIAAGAIAAASRTRTRANFDAPL